MYAKNEFLTPTQKTKRFLRQFPALVQFRKRYLPKAFNDHCSKLDVTKTFPLFRPNSSGHYDDTSFLTINAINTIFPNLSSFCLGFNDRRIIKQKINECSRDEFDLAAARDLKSLLDSYGSDKANHHNYHFLYGSILKNRKSIDSVFEVGLGTNNTEVVSNMGTEGKPGASLRAFRDFFAQRTNFWGGF